MLNVKNFICMLSWTICSDFGAIRCGNVSQPEMAKKSINSYFNVQGHPRSLISVPIKSQYTASYY